MQPEDSIPDEKRPGFFQRAKQSIAERSNNAMALARGDMQSTLLGMVLPYVKKMIPKVEANLKAYLSGAATEYGPGDGIKKTILMKERADGRIEVLVFNANGIEITPTADFQDNPQDVLLQKLNVDEYALRFIQGNFDGATHAADEF